jgi:hypothetical protein
MAIILFQGTLTRDFLPLVFSSNNFLWAPGTYSKRLYLTHVSVSQGELYNVYTKTEIKNLV